MSVETDVFTGARAQHLLEDPVFKKAWADVRQAIIDRWEAAPLRDTEGAHELKLMLRLLTDVQANLEMAVQNGKLAAAELRLRKQGLTPAEWRAATTR